MGNERLASLAAVKSWLSLTTGTADEEIQRLIDAASQAVLNYISRDSFRVSSYTENFRGNGRQTRMFYTWPVISVTSLYLGGSLIPAADDVNGNPRGGWLLNDDWATPHASMDLYGYIFERGVSGKVSYLSGFQATESFDITSGDQSIVPTSGGFWLGTTSVKIDGVEATLVSSDPSAGQYCVNDEGQHTFAPADAGKTAIITYDLCPWDISQAVVEFVAERYKRKGRIGVVSKNLGGQESVTFSKNSLTEDVRQLLQPYVRVIPS